MWLSDVTDIHERMDEEFDSPGNILAAICNAELKEYKSKGKKDSEGGDCSDSEGDHMPIEISNEIDDLQQVSSALRYIIDLVIQNNESIVSIHTNCDDPEKLKHQKNNQMIAESISKHMDKLSSDCSSIKAADEIKEILIQPELFDQVSALDKLLLQIDAGVQLFDSKNSLLSERVALCHYEKQPMEDNYLQKVLGSVTVSPVSFHDLLISSYDCFRKEEEGNVGWMFTIITGDFLMIDKFYQLPYARTLRKNGFDKLRRSFELLRRRSAKEKTGNFSRRKRSFPMQ
jgi:hypothetical protein